MTRGTKGSRAVVALLVMIGAFALVLHVAQAAGPFDGSWTGGAAGTGGGQATMAACNAVVTATVADNVLKGAVAFASAKVPFAGTVAPDGSFKSNAGWVTGKFSGRSFDGQFTLTGGHCNPWRVSLSRG